MQNLTGDSRFPAYLVPSLMEGGNLVKSPAILKQEMTAPGSPPASPMPQAYGGEFMPGPQYSNADANTKTPLANPMAINHPQRLGEHDGDGNTAAGFSGWKQADGEPGPWTEV